MSARASTIRVSDVRAVSTERLVRGDIRDMEGQILASCQRAKMAIYEKNAAEYRKTIRPKEDHIYFLYALIAEVERFHKLPSSRTGKSSAIGSSELHSKLRQWREGEWCADVVFFLEYVIEDIEQLMESTNYPISSSHSRAGVHQTAAGKETMESLPLPTAEEEKRDNYRKALVSLASWHMFGPRFLRNAINFIKAERMRGSIPESYSATLEI